MNPKNEEPLPPPNHSERQGGELNSGSLTAAYATLGFILFWVGAFLAGNALRGRFFVGYVIVAIVASLSFLCVPRLKGIGIGILLGLLLAGGLLLLLMAVCGGMHF